MFHVVLHCPEIPPNAGNAIRLTANSGVRLHLVEPLGFSMDDRHLRRAGLDYHALADVHRHATWKDCLRALGDARLFAMTTQGAARYTDIVYRPGDAFVFGRETSGLPAELLAGFPEDRRVRLPMKPGNRSINLSNAVAIVVYEAWRQLGFAGGV